MPRLVVVSAPMWRSLSLVMLAALGCGAPEPPGSTGGTNVEPGPCGRGVAVVHTDYQSTNVSLRGFDGELLSASFISSATAGAKLSAKLTGDVVPPTSISSGPSLVLIDRYPAAVLTWVDVKSAKVSAQLSVRSGFDANPRDYLALSETEAWVTRMNPSPDPKAGPLDRGNDVLVLDLAGPAPVASIDLGPAMAGEGSEFLARPDRLVRAGGRVLVTLLGQTKDFEDAAPSRLVALDPATRAITEVLVLDGLYECNGLALAPDGQRVAVSCTGRFHGGQEPAVAESGVVVVALGPELEEERRVAALPDAPFGFSVAWAGPNTLVANTFGRVSPAKADQLVEIEVESGASRVLLESKGEPFTLGDVSCGAPCKTCFAADAGRGVVHAFDVDASGKLGEPRALEMDDPIGLAPRFLGQF